MSIFDVFHESTEKTVRESEEKYQVCEFGGELWLTFIGALVCPCSMLKDDPVESLKVMRELYVKRHVGE